jgi:hypothetical protein
MRRFIVDSFKEQWTTKYGELANEMFGCEYWDCTPEQTRQLNVAIRDWELDYLPSLIDAAEARNEDR